MPTVRTRTYTDQYPDVAWMNISIANMESLLLSEELFYFFECDMHDIRVKYRAAKKHLSDFMKCCKVIENGTPRYSFYINPHTGRLFTNAAQQGVSLALEHC